MTVPEAEVAKEIVNDAVTSASFLNHVRQNRIEYILAVLALHLLGVSDRIIGTINGVCF
jgi:hypothetical protein